MRGDLKGPKYREPGVLGVGPGPMGMGPGVLGVGHLAHFREKGGLGSQSAPNLAQIPQARQLLVHLFPLKLFSNLIIF